jgi:hypothetical protein
MIIKPAYEYIEVDTDIWDDKYFKSLSLKRKGAIFLSFIEGKEIPPKIRKYFRTPAESEAE